LPETALRLPGILHLIATPRRPLLTIFLAYILSMAGSLLLATIVGSIVPDARTPDFGWLMGRGLLTVAVLSGMVPLFETLILAGTTSLLLLVVRPTHAILLSSFGWAVAHSYQAPIWGLVIFWPFIIFTTLYIVWKQRSIIWGLFMAFAVHALQNLIPAVMIGYPGLLPGS
jgi:hypothetical protein